MRHNHTLSQGNKATKTVCGGGVGLDMKKRGEGRQYSGVFKKKWGVRKPLPPVEI